MNNEPVAWMFRGYLYEKDPSDWTVHEHPNVPVIPLYTHPAKTLTNGIDLLEKYADKLEDERPNKGLSDVVYECIAILRKAQEK
jgi:hypothetical protein